MTVTQGITSRSFLPDLAQDDQETVQGYNGAAGVTVGHHDGGVRESMSGLPRNLETSPLSAPRHSAGRPSRSQQPARSR